MSFPVTLYIGTYLLGTYSRVLIFMASDFESEKWEMHQTIDPKSDILEFVIHVYSGFSSLNWANSSGFAYWHQMIIHLT